MFRFFQKTILIDCDKESFSVKEREILSQVYLYMRTSTVKKLEANKIYYLDNIKIKFNKMVEFNESESFGLENYFAFNVISENRNYLLNAYSSKRRNQKDDSINNKDTHALVDLLNLYINLLNSLIKKQDGYSLYLQKIQKKLTKLHEAYTVQKNAQDEQLKCLRDKKVKLKGQNSDKKNQQLQKLKDDKENLKQKFDQENKQLLCETLSIVKHLIPDPKVEEKKLPYSLIRDELSEKDISKQLISAMLRGIIKYVGKLSGKKFAGKVVVDQVDDYFWKNYESLSQDRKNDILKLISIARSNLVNTDLQQAVNDIFAGSNFRTGLFFNRSKLRDYVNSEISKFRGIRN